MNVLADIRYDDDIFRSFSQALVKDTSVTNVVLMP